MSKNLPESESEGSQMDFEEMGESEMSDMDEGGEDEVEESEDIDYNTVIKDNVLEHESSDSEEDIIASTIKKKSS